MCERTVFGERNSFCPIPPCGQVGCQEPHHRQLGVSGALDHRAASGVAPGLLELGPGFRRESRDHSRVGELGERLARSQEGPLGLVEPAAQAPRVGQPNRSRAWCTVATSSEKKRSALTNSRSAPTEVSSPASTAPSATDAWAPSQLRLLVILPITVRAASAWTRQNPAVPGRRQPGRAWSAPSRSPGRCARRRDARPRGKPSPRPYRVACEVLSVGKVGGPSTATGPRHSGRLTRRLGGLRRRRPRRRRRCRPNGPSTSARRREAPKRSGRVCFARLASSRKRRRTRVR